MEVDAAGRGEGRHVDSPRFGPPEREKRARHLLGVRFALPRDAEHARHQAGRPRPPGQPLAGERLHHRLQLTRRTGQQHDHAVLVFQPQAWRGAIGIRHDDRALGHECLPQVDVGHLEPAPGESAAEALYDFGVLPHRASECLGDHLAREIIVGRAEAAREHDDVPSRQCGREDGPEVVARISHDGLRTHGDAVLGEALRDEQRVGIEARRREQLAADSDDFSREKGTHAFRLQQCVRCNPEQDAHRDVRVQGRHHVVGHHAHPTVEGLEAARRKRLDHIQHAEDEEPGNHDAPRRGQHEERDQHADHLVDHTGAGIGAAEIAFRMRTAPHADAEQQSDHCCLDGGRRL